MTNVNNFRRSTYSGDPCQETPCLPPGTLGFSGFDGLTMGDVTFPQKNSGCPGGSGLGFLWK
eukprot:2682963-Pyramimonas_sp.AAC.1